MKRVLILGGTGAIGSELVRCLSAREDLEVHVTSRKERASDRSNVRYIVGNAMDDEFLARTLSKERYAAIVDFMAYSTESFSRRVELLLDGADQYLYLSSSRVYADSDRPLTEDSPRLLDVCRDEAYLKTDEYALAKARQEDILTNSGRANYTIVRPYITYGPNRFQLGHLEKELWLQRALSGRAIVFSRDLAERLTTMSNGRDVAGAMARLIGNPAALGQAFHIAQTRSVKWGDVLEVYLGVLEAELGRRPRVVMLDDSRALAKASGREYQVAYDRLYDRRFDDSRIKAIAPEFQHAVEVEEGLAQCLRQFLRGEPSFLFKNPRFEGFADRVASEHSPLGSFRGSKDRLKYLLARYTHYYR